MTFEQLQQHVNAAYDTKSQTLTINHADFASPPVDSLFKNVLNATTVVLTQVSQIVSNGAILSASGQVASMPPIIGGPSPATALFTIDQGQAQVVIGVGFPGLVLNQWKLATFFPQLAKTFVGELAIGPSPSPLFIYSSYSYSDKMLDSKRTIPVQSGLNFSGAFFPSVQPFTALVPIFGQWVNNTMAGPILQQPQGPRMQLTIDEQSTLSQLFTQLSLPITFSLLTDFSPDGQFYQSCLSIEARFTLGSRQNLTISACVNDASLSVLTLDGEFENVAIPSPSELSRWIGGDGNDLTALLPDVFKPSGSVYLDSLTTSINFAQPAIASVGLGLHALPDWELVPGWFTLRSVTGAFSVYWPFASQLRTASMQLSGIIDMPSQNPILQLNADVRLPERTVGAELVEGTTFDLAKLLALFVPAAKDCPSVIFSELALTIDLKQSPAAYQFSSVATASDLSYSFGGTTAIALQSFSFALSCGGNGNPPTQATVNALLTIFDASVDADYDPTKGFKIGGKLPAFDVDLQKLTSELVGIGASQIAGWLPTLIFEETELYLAHDSRAATSNAFVLRTRIGGLPSSATLAFEALERGAWGFVVGLDLSGLPKLSSFPGLSGLSPFDEMFRLAELLMVVSTVDAPDYSFPGAAEFADPRLATTKIALPAQAAGVQRGVYVHAKARLDTKAVAWLAKFLRLTGDVGIALFIGANPVTSSKLTITLADVQVTDALTLSGSFGGTLQDGQIGFFLQGQARATVAQQPLVFDVLMVVVANGALVSGTMKGTIAFSGIQLSNLALEIGVSTEGIPSFGVAATIDTADFDSSIAVFFDSGDPSKSLLAGAISDLTLAQLYDAVLGAAVPLSPTLAPIFQKIAVRGTGAFTLDGSLADELDNLDVKSVSAAFTAQGRTLPSAQSQVLLVVNQASKRWAITDLTTMQHYLLERETSGQIAAKYEAQLYCAPADTRIGTVPFKAGFFAAGQVELYFVTATVDVLIDSKLGISADVQLSPIVMGDWFKLTAASGSGGPSFSLATFTRDGVPPHVAISGAIDILGAANANLALNADKNGFNIDFTYTFSTTYKLQIVSDMQSSGYLNATGSAQVAIGTIDLGVLGKVAVNTTVGATLSILISTSSANAAASAIVRAAGQTLSLGFEVDLGTAKTLASFADQLVGQVEQQLQSLYQDVSTWLKAVKAGLVGGFSSLAQVVQALASQFGLSQVQIIKDMLAAGFALYDVAKSMMDAFHLSVSQLVSLLYQAGVSASDVAKLELELQQSPDTIGQTLQSVFGLPAPTVAQLLFGLFPAVVVGQVMQQVFGLDGLGVAQLFQQLGVSPNDIAAMLKSVFGMSAQAIAQMFQVTFKWTSSIISSALSYAGFSTNDVTNALDALDPLKW